MVDYESFKNEYKIVWERLDSGRSYDDFYKAFASKEDFPASEEDYHKLLKSAGFKVATLHLYLDRAIFMGVK